MSEHGPFMLDTVTLALRGIGAVGERLSKLSFDGTAAERFGMIAAALAADGVPIGQMDTLIAAHALSVRATLVTNNERHFSKVGGLRIESWV